MIEIPMQDARQSEFRELTELQPKRASRKADLVGDAHQILQRRAAKGNPVAPAKLGEVGLIAEIAGHHGQAREPAFGRLHLEHHRKASLPPEPQSMDQVHQRHVPVMVNSGSKIHSIRRRLSIITSASSCIPGCRGVSTP